MESTLQLSVEERAEKASTIRSQGRIPAVAYGRGIPSRALSVSFLDFSRVYGKAGENTLVELSLAKEKPFKALIHDVQVDPLSGKFIHIDFYQVRMDEKVETSVPLTFVGESPAVRSLGGILIKALDEVEVSCLPADIPHEFSVDVSVLETFSDQIRISDIVAPKGVLIVSEPETAVALVERPRSDAEMAALDEKVEADVSAVEGVVKETSVAPEKKSE